MKQQTTIRFTIGQKPVFLHNSRDTQTIKKQPHIDVNGKHANWLSMTEIQAYSKLFSESIAEYNAKQKRSDRILTIEKYLNKVKNDSRGKINKRETRVLQNRTGDSSAVVKGKHSSYEVIVSIGSSAPARDENNRRTDKKGGTRTMPYRIPEEINKKILKEYFDKWEERNPNFFLSGAYYHADEFFIDNLTNEKIFSTPHLHLTFIPFSDGYKQGLSRQSSLNRALKNMSCSDFTQWCEREREYTSQIVKKYLADYEIIHPYTNRGFSKLETTDYKALQDQATNLDIQIQEQEERLEAIDEAQTFIYKNKNKQIEKERAILEQSQQAFQQKVNNFNNNQLLLYNQLKELLEETEERKQTFLLAQKYYNKPKSPSSLEAQFIETFGLSKKFEEWKKSRNDRIHKANEIIRRIEKNKIEHLLSEENFFYNG